MAVNRRILAVKPLVAPKGKTTGWQQPVMAPKWYTLFCCDCGLGHRLQFRIRKQKVGFRIKPAHLYTQMLRKHGSMKSKVTCLKKGEKIVALVDGAMVITLINGLRRGGGKVERKKKKGKNRG